MLKETLESIDSTTNGIKSMVKGEMSLSDELKERYEEYQNDDRFKVESGTESKIVDNIFFKIDMALQKGIKSINRYFLNTSIFLDNSQAYETITPNITDLYKQRSDIMDLVKDGALFATIANKKTPVLAGFKLKLKDGANIISNHIDFIKNLESNLSSFEDTLDTFINSKKDNVKLSINVDSFDNLESMITEVNKDLALTTNKKVIVDRLPVKKIVSNFNELVEVTDELLKYGKYLNMETLEKANEHLSIIMTKLDIIQNAIEKDKLKLSKDDFNRFVDYIGIMAKYVTASSFLIYFYLQLINMTLGVMKVATIAKEDNTTLSTISAYITGTFENASKLFSK